MKLLDLICGDYSDQATWETLRDTLDEHKSEHAVFYMAIPPTHVPEVAQRLASVGLNERGRIVVEKPFGRDLASAQELNATLHSVFPEERIFRIDHYLGKESVEDLLVFRFSNTLLEPIWNRSYVRSVQVTMSETIGVEGRGSFYDGVGALRDVLQNHLLQVVCAAGDGAAGRARRDGSCRTRRPRCWRRWSRSTRTDVVRGQYVGYRDEPGVAPDSTTETFVAARLEIDSWRWAGVPGTCASARAWPPTPPRRSSSSTRRRACCSTRPAGRPRTATSCACGWASATASRSRSRPRRPASTSTARRSTSPSTSPPPSASARRPTSGCSATPSPARRAGSPARTSSSRRGAVVQPALDEPGPVHPYFRGSWGPSEADRLLARRRPWFEPDVQSRRRGATYVATLIVRDPVPE